MYDQSSTRNANSSVYSKCEFVIHVYGHHLTLQVPAHCTIASESTNGLHWPDLLLRFLLLKNGVRDWKKGEWPWRKSSKSKDHNGLVQEGHELRLLNSMQNCTNYVDFTHFIFFTFFKKQTRVSQQAQARIWRANEKLTIACAVAFLVENSVQFEISTLNDCNNANNVLPFPLSSELQGTNTGMVSYDGIVYASPETRAARYCTNWSC